MSSRRHNGPHVSLSSSRRRIAIACCWCGMSSRNCRSITRVLVQCCSSKGSCTSSLRVIPPPPKPGTMLPYHTIVRGYCHDAAPCLLPTRDPGTLVALGHAALRLVVLHGRVPEPC